MTANASARFTDNILARLSDGIQAGLRLAARIILGGLFIVAAGIVALATAGLGLLIAFAAIIMRLTRARQPASDRSASGETDGFVLEARRSARGWTVE